MHKYRPPRERPAVMGDVAALAGVSQMTVSRVINDRPGVGMETRGRVLAAMRELDYRPNAAARALVTGHSRTLGIVTFDTALYGPSSTLNAIEHAARSAGYYVSVATLRTLDRPSMSDAVNRLLDQAVTGIVVIAPQTSNVEALGSVSVDVPIVVVEGGAGAGSPVVAVDQVAGASRATQHLLSLGHETVWHISGPVDWLEAQGRVAGWREALEAADREVPPVMVGDWSPKRGYELGKDLARNKDVTAVFVANDQMALGVLRAMREAEIDVPDEMSIVGFDDIPEAAYFAPPLTTVRQDFGEVGLRSLHLLLRQIEGRPLEQTRVVIEPDLVLRQSSGQARKRQP